LVALGSNGVWVEEEKGSVHLKVFFPGDLSQMEIIKSIRKTLTTLIPQKKISIASEQLPEEQWQTAWQKHSIPRQKIGKKLLVIPPWEKIEKKHTKRKVITLSPGMAFGTGTHGTTRTCLIFLEEVLTKGKTKVMLDVGTGSGILAIAGAKLGISQITAVENDPVALKAAKENAKENRVSPKINFRKTISRQKTFSIVTANISAVTLRQLENKLSKVVSQRGYLILSGLLKEEYKEIFLLYGKFFSLIQTKQKNGWVTLLLRKK